METKKTDGRPQQLEGYVIIWGSDGDGTTTDIVGASVGTRFPMQYDAVWPYLFHTKTDAEAYVNQLQQELLHYGEGVQLDGLLIVPIDTIKVNRAGTRELAATCESFALSEDLPF
jgi:hypothetical protein